MKKIELLIQLKEWEEREPFLEDTDIDAVVVVVKEQEQEQAVAAANEFNSDSEEFGETQLM